MTEVIAPLKAIHQCNVLSTTERFNTTASKSVTNLIASCESFLCRLWQPGVEIATYEKPLFKNNIKYRHVVCSFSHKLLRQLWSTKSPNDFGQMVLEDELIMVYGLLI